MSIKNIVVYSQTLPPFQVGGIETNAYHLVRYLASKTDFRFTVLTATKKKLLLRKTCSIQYGDVTFSAHLINKKRLASSADLLRYLSNLNYHPDETAIYHNSLDLYRSYPAIRSAGYRQVGRSGGNDLSFLQKKAGSRDEFSGCLSALDCLFVNSEFSRDRAIDIGIDTSRLMVVKGGCDIHGPNDSIRTELGLPLDKPVVLSCGRLVDFKGLDDAIQAVNQLSQEGLEFLYVIVGTGPLQRALEQKAERLGVLNRCLFVGKVPPDEIAAYYQAADLYLSASKDVVRTEGGFRYVHTETMGRSICEAQGCGVPVVSTNAGGAPEVIVDGATGVVVPQGDVGAMAGAISEFLRNPERTRLMGKAALSFADQQLSWESVLQQYCATIGGLPEPSGMPKSH